MSLTVNDKDLGLVTAYAYAVAGGYEGTEAEFEALLGNVATDLSEIENLTVTVTTLPAGSSATASYSNGVLSLGIPKGDTGATGATGNGIASITKTGTSGNVDTYTITYTNGNSTTFTVTNGAVTSVAGKTGAVTLDADDVAYDPTDTYASGTVGEAVSDLKSAIADDIERYTTPTENLWKPLWELGALKWADGTPESSTTIMRSAGFINVEPGTTYAFYDGRDWTKAQYNMLYPIQWVFEYGADGTYIKNTAIYIQQFKTGDTTYKVKFRSNTLPAGFDFSTYNTKKFLLYKGAAYRDYVPPYPLLDDSAYPFEGEASDNLFPGGMFGLVNDSNGSVSVIVTSACTSSNWIKVKKSEHPIIYFHVSGYFESYTLGIALCYDANKMYLGRVNAVTISNSVFGNVGSFVLLDNTEYVILRSGEYSGTEENLAKIAALKTACEQGLYVSTSLENIYSNHQIDGANKISGENINYGFLETIRNDNIRDFMLTGLKSYVSGLLATGYDALIPAMTDIHAFSYEPWAVINYMADSGAADVAVNLGDNIVDHFDTKAEAVSFLRDRFGIQFKYTVKAPMLSAVGNHDTNPVNGSNISDGSKMLHPDELYSLMRMRNSPGMLSGKCYGYYDLVNAKIRVVILNTSDIYDTDGTPLCAGNNTAVSQAQFDWFCDVALDFSGKDDADEWAVITMSHDRLSVVGGTGNPFATVITAFTTGTSGTATGSRTLDGHTFTLSKAVNYSSQGVIEYIGHICGHYHDDNMTVFATNYKEVEIPCAILTAHYYDGATRKDYTRTKGTTEELLFDTVCIDRANRSVLMKRFGGVGADRTFTYGA